MATQLLTPLPSTPVATSGAPNCAFVGCTQPTYASSSHGKRIYRKDGLCRRHMMQKQVGMELQPLERVPVQEEPATADCVHHWLVAPANGPTSEGVCRTCGSTRTFYNSVEMDHLHEFGYGGSATPAIWREVAKVAEVW